MGFGLLLCGYFVLFMMSFGMAQYGFAAMLIGGFISFCAAGRLKDYCVSFKWTMVMSVIYVLLGIWQGVAFLNDMFLFDLKLFDVAAPIIVYVDFALGTAYNLFMLYSVLELSGQLGLVKIKSRATFELGLTVTLAIFQILIFIIPPLANMENQMPTKFLILFTLVAYIINLLIIYSCYNNICPEGEEMGKERKPSRFKFVNEMRRKVQEREDRAVRESLDYIKEKQEKKKQRKERKHNK